MRLLSALLILTVHLFPSSSAVHMSHAASQKLSRLAQRLEAAVETDIVCRAGSYLNIKSCVVCPAGYYCPEGSTLGAGSAANYLVNKCPPGYFCPAGTSSATQHSCNPGSFSSASATKFSDCVRCKAGQYAPASASTSCMNCPIGSWSDEGAESCTVVDWSKDFLAQGYITDAKGKPTCKVGYKNVGPIKLVLDNRYPVGCDPIPCNAGNKAGIVGVIGAAGRCVCDERNNYEGTVTYDATTVTGGCALKHCSKTYPSSSHIQAPGCANFAHGTSCTISCDAGYTLTAISPSSLSCSYGSILPEHATPFCKKNQ